MPKIRDRAPLSKLKNKEADPTEVRTRVQWHRRQSPYAMNHVNIASQRIKFTIYKVLP